MDSAQSNTPINVTTDISHELAHINEEMYKKNLLLAETNKTLSLLRKIDAITLSSVTDIEEVAQGIANVVLTDMGFKQVSIILVNSEENSLKRLTIAHSNIGVQLSFDYQKVLKESVIPMNCTDNLIVNAISKKQVCIAPDLYFVLLPNVTREQAHEIQTTYGIIDTLINPIIVRNEVIGAIRISMAEQASKLSDYRKDLISRLTGVIGIALDNTLLYQQLQTANENLKQLDKLKDEFVSLASHELRTPMTAIKSYLWMIMAGKAGEIPEKQKYYLDRAYKSTDRLINLVNDMLNVSRIESGKITLAKQTTDINILIKDTLFELSPRSQELGLSILYTPNLSLPTVHIDPDKVKEVFINLIGNAFKFTPKGGSIAITVNVLSEQKQLQIAITDTGAGISKEDTEKLFQKFAVVGNDLIKKQNSQGTGLGLYICKSLIEMHGGRIWVTSEGLGRGTTFTFTLPVA